MLLADGKAAAVEDLMLAADVASPGKGAIWVPNIWIPTPGPDIKDCIPEHVTSLVPVVLRTLVEIPHWPVL
jgi:hypothetical protein